MAESVTLDTLVLTLERYNELSEAENHVTALEAEIEELIRETATWKANAISSQELIADQQHEIFCLTESVIKLAGYL